MNTFADFIASQIIIDRAEQNLKSWARIIGIEGVVELVEKYKDKPYAKIYIDLLKEKGIKINV